MNSYSYNTSIQSIGNVNKYPARNNSFTPFNVINPKTNNITQLPYVNSRKTIPLNIKSKLSGSQCVEGLYNVRSNTSLNNSTRVPEQFYNDRIDEKRRNNALMTDTNQAMRVRWNNNTTFNEYPDNNSSFSVKISSEDVDSNSIRFSDLIQEPVNVKSVQYNPYVLPSSQNKPYNSNYNKISYPDERLTSYSGERSYMTEGDRILQSAALATSKSNIEKRELQNQAYNALMKHASAPRMLGADITKGINTYHNSAYDCDELAFNYGDVVESSNAIKGRHQPNLDNKVIESNEFINPNDTNYISETTVRETFNNEFDVGIDNKPKKYNENQRQQLNESYLKQLFNNILSSFNTLVTRFRSTDSNLNIQHLISAKLKHRLSEIMNNSDDTQLNSLNLDTILNDSVVQEQLSKIRAVIKNNVTNNRINVDDVDEYVDSILFNNFITYINTITGNRSNIHNSIHNRKYKNEYQTDINEDYINLETPVSLISDDNGTLIRSTIIRDNDKYLILTRKEYNDDTIEYIFGQVELDELERILRKDISSNDTRLVNSLNPQTDFTNLADKPGSLNLEYEDYIKLLEYIEDSPYEFIQTTVPIHQYQRDILDNDTNFETLLYGSIDNSKSYTQDNRDETIRLKRHVEGLSTFKDNDEDNHYIHSIHNPTNNNTNDRLNLTNQSKITQEVNPKKIYKTLTNLM